MNKLMPTTRTEHRLRWEKSRLAGFFLSLLLLGCGQEPAVPGSLAFSQAQTAAKAGLSIKSEELLATAITQGHPKAVDQWLLQTNERLGPLAQLAQLRQWQVGALTPAQQQHFGLWQHVATSLPKLSGIQKPACHLSIQPVLSSSRSIQQWQQWQASWPKTQIAELSLCMLPPVLLDAEVLACSEQIGQRISCNEQALWPLATQQPTHLMLVLAGRGGASFNNGLLILPEQASLALFQHELSHAFGFIDEYAYPVKRQQVECLPGRITANLLFDRADLPAYLAHWQLTTEQVQLTPVDTCGETLPALKVVASTTHMQHYELAIPALYLDLMHHQLKKPAQIMPVSYYFAAMARRQQQMQHWPALMQTAAGFGYMPAQLALQAAQMDTTAPTAAVSSTTR